MTLVTEAPVAPSPVLTRLPVVIIGAGPVGLAAAAHLLERGIEPLVLEQGDRVGAAIRQWGHTRLFSPWKHVTDTASVRLLSADGWKPQHPEAMPTGDDLVKYYLEPLAATPALRDRIRFGVRVDAVSRLGMDRTRTTGRTETPFVVRLGTGDELQARAVIDASGTFGMPNPVIASGFRPRQESAVAAHLTHGLPDVLGRDRARFAGKHTVVVGRGTPPPTRCSPSTGSPSANPARPWPGSSARPRRRGSTGPTPTNSPGARRSGPPCTTSCGRVGSSFSTAPSSTTSRPRPATG